MAYHDDGERHGESRDAGEERRGSYESHRSRIHPHPERIGGDSAVDVDEHAANRSTVQTADKPASRHLLLYPQLSSLASLFLRCYLRRTHPHYLVSSPQGEALDTETVARPAFPTVSLSRLLTFYFFGGRFAPVTSTTVTGALSTIRFHRRSPVLCRLSAVFRFLNSASICVYNSSVTCSDTDENAFSYRIRHRYDV